MPAPDKPVRIKKGQVWRMKKRPDHIVLVKQKTSRGWYLLTEKGIIHNTAEWVIRRNFDPAPRDAFVFRGEKSKSGPPPGGESRAWRTRSRRNKKR